MKKQPPPQERKQQSQAQQSKEDEDVTEGFTTSITYKEEDEFNIDVVPSPPRTILDHEDEEEKEEVTDAPATTNETAAAHDVNDDSNDENHSTPTTRTRTATITPTIATLPDTLDVNNSTTTTIPLVSSKSRPPTLEEIHQEFGITDIDESELRQQQQRLHNIATHNTIFTDTDEVTNKKEPPKPSSTLETATAKSPPTQKASKKTTEGKTTKVIITTNTPTGTSTIREEEASESNPTQYPHNGTMARIPNDAAAAAATTQPSSTQQQHRPQSQNEKGNENNSSSICNTKLFRYVILGGIITIILLLIATLIVTIGILRNLRNDKQDQLLQGGSNTNDVDGELGRRISIAGGQYFVEEHKVSSSSSSSSLTPPSIMDHLVIDLDQNLIMENILSNTMEGYTTAYNIYRNGGHSQSIATLTSSFPSTSPSRVDRNSSSFGDVTQFALIRRGTRVIGLSNSGDTIRGVIHEDVPMGSNTIQVQYDNYRYDVKVDDPNQYCRVGALPKPETKGCFSSSGEIRLDMTDDDANLPFPNSGSSLVLKYTKYNVTSDTINQRTLQSFSLDSVNSMNPCPTYCGHVEDNKVINIDSCPRFCYYDHYAKFRTYYGSLTAYGDDWIHAAFNAIETPFENSGNVDFSSIGFEGRVEAIQVGTLVLNVLMRVIGKMEDAITVCKLNSVDKNGNKQDNVSCSPDDLGICRYDAVDLWDQAVAYYAGSLTTAQSDSYFEDIENDGVLLYSLANELCSYFGTCASETSTAPQQAAINRVVMDQFRSGQTSLLKGRCDRAASNMERIVSQMIVIVAQGLLFNAGKLSVGNFNHAREQHIAQALAATYAAALLPFVHDCNPAQAQVLYEFVQLPVLTSQVNRVDLEVRWNLEWNYDCLGIKCKEVGWLEGAYNVPLVGPCYQFVPDNYGTGSGGNSGSASRGDKSDGRRALEILGFIIWYGFLIGLIIGCVWCCRKNDGTIRFDQRNVQNNQGTAENNAKPTRDVET